MFTLTTTTLRPRWKRVEADFVLGSCSQRLFGYVSQDADGTWTAFDEDAHAVASGPDRESVGEQLWARHEAVHAEKCAVLPLPRGWRRAGQAGRERQLSPSR